jgi:outer membrane protein OmpA-like peptidoglycan-associated protein
MDILAQNIIQSVARLKKIQLIGHTDDVGTDSYNINLAKKRVEFVITELVKRGVPENILEGKYAGKSKTLQKRESEDLEMWRKRLRRVELQKFWNN